MLKRLAGIWLLVLALMISGGLQAQTGGWIAWTYDANNQIMSQISAGGLQRDLTLVLSAGYDTFEQGTVEVSPYGNLVAYVVRDSVTLQMQLVVYDLIGNAILLTYDLGAGVSYAGVPSFSDSGDRIAFGMSLDPEGWEIVVIDLSTFAISNIIQHTDPGAAGIPFSFNLTPYIVAFNGDEVGFTLVLSAAGGAWQYDGFVWDLVSNSIAPNVGYIQPFPSISPTSGEVLMSLFDDSFPNRSADFPFGQGNTIQVYEPSTAARIPVFTNANFSFESPTFAENGNLIVVGSYDIDTDKTFWTVYDRLFTPFISLSTDFDVDSMAGIANGFIYVTSASGSTELYEYDTSNPGANSTDLGTPIHNWGAPMFQQIVWVGSEDGSPAFTTPVSGGWSPIGDAITASDSGGSGGGSAPGVLAEGVTATVNTTEGDALNLRSGAGTSFQIIRRLTRGMTVTVLEGPVSANGFNWWRVRTGNGESGWVVDFADGVPTLVVGDVPATSETVDEDVSRPNPAIESLLRIGDTAEVTLANPRDALRMRNSADLDARIVSLLPDGTRVQVIDGPRENDGFQWWQIRSPEGNVGWAVEIVGNERVLSVASATVSVTNTPPPATGALTPPILISPLPNEAVSSSSRTVTLKWSPVIGADRYTVETEACAGVTTPICSSVHLLTDVRVTEAVVSFPNDFGYRWRVTAVAANGTTATSAWGVFSVMSGLPAPMLISPADGQVFDIFPRDTVLTWQGVSTALGYEVEIQYCTSNETSSCVALQTVPVTGTSFSFAFVGAQPGRWRVRTEGPAGVFSAWSEWRSFRYTR